MKSNPNGKKIDLEKVLCDFEACVYRGEMSDCYISFYTTCKHYLIYEYYSQNQKKGKDRKV